MKIGIVLLYLVAGIQTLTAGALMLGNGESTFETDTGVAWGDLVASFPTVAAQFSDARTASLVASLAIGLLCLAIIHFAFRERQSWAWFALWILPLYMLPGVINLARSDDPVWVAVFAGTIMLIAVAGLLISYRSFFKSR